LSPRRPDRPTSVSGAHTAEMVTAMLPRVALLYGHTWWAASIKVVTVASSTSGICTSRRTDNPNPPLSMVPGDGGPIDTDLAPPSHHAQRTLETGGVACGEQLLGIGPAAGAAHLDRWPEIHIEVPVRAPGVPAATPDRGGLRRIERLDHFRLHHALLSVPSQPIRDRHQLQLRQPLGCSPVRPEGPRTAGPAPVTRVPRSSPYTEAVGLSNRFPPGGCSPAPIPTSSGRAADDRRPSLPGLPTVRLRRRRSGGSQRRAVAQAPSHVEPPRRGNGDPMHALSGCPRTSTSTSP
jgi:hypothetical protein